MEANMRLSAEQVKQGLVHPERIVRDCALRYFSESFSDDPTVMPLAIQAIEAHGWEGAFEYHHLLDRLAQTDETLLWLIDRLNKMGRPQTHEQVGLCRRLASVISHADAALLMKHEQDILGLEGLESGYRDVIADRLRLMTLGTDSCWRELEQLCQRYKGTHYINKFPIGDAFLLCEAIARDGECVDRVLSILSGKIENYDNNPMVWMECFAAHLAGAMRLEEAAPLLVNRLRDDGGDLMNEECMYALTKIGTDRAVEAICADWLSSPDYYRMYASSSLRNMHSDMAVARCLDLYEQEASGDFKVRLLRAALATFSLDGIEPAHQLILKEGWDLHRELLAVALLAGIELPELQQWKAEEEEEAERLKQRREMLFSPAPKRRAQPAAPFGDLMDPAPVAPITRKDKVGRNDTCPCGSGKKYKKCCGQ
jgi:hypothetical protein